MKRAALIVFLASLGAGCGLDTTGLGDLSHQPGSTGSQHAEAGTHVEVADASPSAAQAGDAASAPDATPSGCGASTCSGGAVCCAEDLGGGITATSCAPQCKGGALVVCDPAGAPCADGDCGPSGKFPALNVCD